MALRRQASRRLAGALIAAGIIGCVASIFMLGGLIEMLQGSTDVIAVLSDAHGVQRGTTVWIAGTPAGRVKRVELLPPRAGAPSRIAATLEIVGKDFDQVRAGSTVRVMSERLVSGSVIEILPGPPTNPPLAENDTLYGRGAATADNVKADAASLKASLDSLAGEAASLAEPARRFARRAEHIQRNLGSVQAELAAVQRLLRSDADGGVRLDSAFLAKLDRMMATASELGVAFRQARSRYAGASTELIEPIARVERRADTLSARIAAFRSLLDAPAAPGAPARIRADSAIFVAIRGARAQLDSLIAEVSRDPFRFAF